MVNLNLNLNLNLVEPQEGHLLRWLLSRGYADVPGS